MTNDIQLKQNASGREMPEALNETWVTQIHVLDQDEILSSCLPVSIT